MHQDRFSLLSFPSVKENIGLLATPHKAAAGFLGPLTDFDILFAVAPDVVASSPTFLRGDSA